MKRFFLYFLILTLINTNCINAQVKTNFNNREGVGINGKFTKPYSTNIPDYIIAAKNKTELLNNEKTKQLNKNVQEAVFEIAVPVSVNLNISKLIKWTTEKEFAYGKYTIKLNGALSASINFDKFFLPKGTEMYIYNEQGKMITGPITEEQNNIYNVWGSWVYKGSYIIIEIKTPISSLRNFQLHSNNLAYGYREIYNYNRDDFNNSESCNINVLCPQGNGWEAERNSVARGLDQFGTKVWSGTLVMNTCNTKKQYFLTANHVLQRPGEPNDDVTKWRFNFQYWSPSCANPSTDVTSIILNGADLKANYANTDFCLVEIREPNPTNLGITLAGWDRSNGSSITQTTILHHPVGDFMKITKDYGSPISASINVNNVNVICWKLNIDEGALQPGSSGSPYFDQNHRIFAQHFGTSDGFSPTCDQKNQWGGRFNASWLGGGSQSNNLAGWLDPSGTNLLTTNTTDIANLNGSNPPFSPVIGYFTTNPPPQSGGTGSSQTPLANSTYQNFYVPRNSYVSMNFYITPPTFPINKWSESNSPSTTTGLNYNSSVQASPYGYGTVIKTIYLDAGYSCGTIRKEYTFRVVSLGWSYRIAVSPNPTKDNFNINITIVDDKTGEVLNEKHYQKSSIKSNNTIMSLYEINSNKIVKQWKFEESDNMNYNIKFNGLKAGVYILKMERDGQITTSKVLIL